MAVEPIDGVELGDVVAEASKQLIRERYDGTVDLVKKAFERADGLAQAVKKGKQELKKNEEKLEKQLAKIEKLRAGDWSVLTEDNNQDKKEEKKEDKED